MSVHSVARWRRRFGLHKGGGPAAAALAAPVVSASAETERELRALRREVEDLPSSARS